MNEPAGQRLVSRWIAPLAAWAVAGAGAAVYGRTIGVTGAAVLACAAAVVSAFALLLARTGEKRHRAETATRAERDAPAVGALESLVDAHPDAAVLMGEGGRILRVNAAAARVLGGEPGALAGVALRERLTRGDLISLVDAAESRANATPPSARVRVPHTDGERVWDATALPLPPIGGSTKFTLLLVRDVTELAEAGRVKTEFVANASHELRTPIASLRAAVDTLRESGRGDPRMLDRGLEMISRQVGRLEELVRDLLDLARVEDSELRVRAEPLGLAELLDSLRTEFEMVCRERGLEIRFDVDPALDGVSTDRRLLALAVRNLVENATKYAYERTTILVKAKRLGRDGGEWQRWEVADRGVGIPLNLQQRVFERFYQADTARSGTPAGASPALRRGTGLGLAIVRHAVRAMGGKVGLESIYKEGTTVWLEAPIPPMPEVGAGDDRAD